MVIELTRYMRPRSAWICLSCLGLKQGVQAFTEVNILDIKHHKGHFLVKANEFGRNINEPGAPEYRVKRNERTHEILTITEDKLNDQFTNLPDLPEESVYDSHAAQYQFQQGVPQATKADHVKAIKQSLGEIAIV